jgi:hypothetical protein
MFSYTQRQAAELLKTARQVLRAQPGVEFKNASADRIELTNSSRIVCLPSDEDSIRGYSSPSLLIFDEAARVPDEIYVAARPMLAVSGGRIIALSTPDGQQGWFHREWISDDDWHRTTITAADCPRITPEFLAKERQRMTADQYASEYECQFIDALDSVFFTRDIHTALNPDLEPLYEGGW